MHSIAAQSPVYMSVLFGIVSKLFSQVVYRDRSSFFLECFYFENILKNIFFIF